MIAFRRNNAAVVYFYYDSQGNVTSMSFEGTKYFFIKNIQGDVEKIVTHQGNVAVTYKYDAWGKLISKTDNTVYGIGELNPFRYRGYIYDDETGLYYLKSRYYDPITGRFLNSDNPIYIGMSGTVLSINVFSYSDNNPIVKYDPDGTSTASILLNIASIIISYAMLSSGWLWLKICVGIVIGVASAIITIRDYNNQVKKLKSQYKKHKISKSTYKSKMKNALFWKRIGLIAAAITCVCSIVSIPVKPLVNSIGVAVVNALGFAKGMVLSRAALINDLISAINHKPKYS